MSARSITHPDQADAGWLTDVLLEAGALREGRVATVERNCQSSSWSRSVWLEPRYEEGASGERPHSLLLKICVDAAESFGPSEYHYYTRDYRGYPAAPLVRCYHAAYQPAPRAYHLLLADLRATHADGFQVASSLELARASADALARLHARYWGAAGLAELGLGLATPAELQAYFSHIEPGLDPLLEDLGEALPLARRELLRRIFGEHPRLLHTRLRDERGFTLVHGDLNPGNLLWPRQGVEPVYLIDRQPFDWSLQRWLGVSDLARLLIIPWAPELRREWQLPVLRRYQEVLGRAGLELPWPLLLDDYRLAALESVQIAVEWCADPVTRVEKRGLWEWMLGRALEAVDDLDCAALLV
jgi:Phosphotransferase enzyme family